MATLERGNLFQPELVTDLINKVKGKSTVAVLSAQRPIPFNGQKEFTFTMDKEIDIVAESGAKSHGGITITPRTIVPYKIEYGARVSNEFMYASEEEAINILKAFNDGFALKVAKGLDLMSFHGINPRTGSASAIIGTNHFDAAVTQKVEYVAASIDDNIEAAVQTVQGAGGTVTGLALSPAASAALAALKVSGQRLYPELAWGGNPGNLNGLKIDINGTVSGADTIAKDRAIVGDFANSFRWGYAKEVPLEVIEYGNPDNDAVAGDLKGHNQVYLRCELFLGWAVLEPSSFVRIVDDVA